MKINKKTAAIVAAGLLVCGAGAAAYRVLGWGHLGPVNSLRLDLSKPDALIVTRSLSALPRDLLSVPLARDVLREDFLFYYEQNEDRLGLKGTLRRIAYEHALTWGDQLIRMVLDEPAEVALWRDADGALKHFAIAVSRGTFTRLLEESGKIALKDSQLSVAGSVRVDGDKVPVYALAYASNRTLLFAARGSRMVILSHPGMLYGEGGAAGDGTAEQTVAALLAADPAKRQLLRRQFQLDGAAPEGHSVAVKADFLSFGYQPFFGALDALRFDFTTGGGWSTRALIDGAKLQPGGYDSAALWPVLPHDPSACFSLPVDWASTQAVLSKLSAHSKTPVSALSERLSGPAAVCWYGNSRLYTPVFVATVKPGASVDGLYDSLFEAAIGRAGAGPVQKKSAGQGRTVWRREVKTALGNQHPSMGQSGRTVVFSADAALVERVLAVARKQGAAAADRLPEPARTVGLIAPAALADLIRKETFDVLPAAGEPVLRGAADAHLVPRLNALKKYPAYRMVLTTAPTGGLAWLPVAWQAIDK
ncbi:MAG: DUF2138 family protein [Pseudomonadota bacterium]